MTTTPVRTPHRDDHVGSGFWAAVPRGARLDTHSFRTRHRVTTGMLIAHVPVLTLIGRVNHWLLYAIFLIMPVSGYLLSALSGRDTPYFWLFTIPGLTKDEGPQKIAESIHLVGQWFVYALVLLHIAGTVWHLVIRRDGLLERMLPVQDGRGSR